MIFLYYQTDDENSVVGVCLEPGFCSSFNHSCVPNCAAHFSLVPGSAPKVAIRSLAPIADGEQMFLSYIDVTLPRSERASELKRYGFTCKCSRCSSEEDCNGADEAKRHKALKDDTSLADALIQSEKFEEALPVVRRCLAGLIAASGIPVSPVITLERVRLAKLLSFLASSEASILEAERETSAALRDLLITHGAEAPLSQETAVSLKKLSAEIDSLGIKRPAAIAL